MIQQTSLAAYRDIQESLPEKQQKVFEVIKGEDKVSDKGIARKLCWEINRVTPRRLELYQAGLIIFAGYGFEQKRKVMLWSSEIR